MEDMTRNFNLDLLGTPQVKNRDNNNKKKPQRFKEAMAKCFLNMKT